VSASPSLVSAPDGPLLAEDTCGPEADSPRGKMPASAIHVVENIVVAVRTHGRRCSVSHEVLRDGVAEQDFLIGVHEVDAMLDVLRDGPVEGSRGGTPPVAPVCLRVTRLVVLAYRATLSGGIRRAGHLAISAGRTEKELVWGVRVRRVRHSRLGREGRARRRAPRRHPHYGCLEELSRLPREVRRLKTEQEITPEK